MKDLDFQVENSLIETIFAIEYGNHRARTIIDF
jgi:hypothetical protein